MGIQRAGTLYPVNSTTVDTGGTVDVRFLSDSEPGANDDTQTASSTHTNDNQNWTLDPGGAATAGNAETTLANRGWALRLTEDMTPTDDTNCNASLLAGTLTVNLQVAVNQSGGTYTGGSYGPNWRASLWRYNPSSNTGTLIASGNTSSPTWNYTPVTGDLGTFKAVAISIIVSSLTEFSAGEILLLQVGLNTGTIPNPTVGTATWTYTLRVDNSGTNITFAAGQGVRQMCTWSQNIVGSGTSTRVLANAVSRDVAGRGIPTSAKASTISKSFDLVGRGDPTMTRVVVASKSFELTGKGEPTHVKNVGVPRAISGSGATTTSKAVAEDFDVVGKGTASRGIAAILIPRSITGTGTVTEVHPVQAFRTFSLTGKGEISGRIEIPLDEIPEPTGGTTVVRRPIYPIDD